MNQIRKILKPDNITRRHLAYATKRLHDELFCRLHTIAASLRLWYWQVPFGDNLSSYGKLRVHLSVRAQMTIGSNCTFRSAEWSNSAGLNRCCYLSANGDGHLFIGDHCGFSGTIISSSSHIEIGNRVLMGANCTIIDSNRHSLDSRDRTANSENIETAPIIIEDDVFLGMNVVVLKGVTIGKRSVIAANAVVVRSIPDRVIAAGVPARIIASL